MVQSIDVRYDICHQPISSVALEPAMTHEPITEVGGGMPATRPPITGHRKEPLISQFIRASLLKIFLIAIFVTCSDGLTGKSRILDTSEN